MQHRFPAFVVATALLAHLVAPLTGAAATRHEPASTESAGTVLFVENVGQFAPAARFQARLDHATLWLAQDALWVTLIDPGTEELAQRPPMAPVPNVSPSQRPARGVHLKLTFVGANAHPLLEPEGRRSTSVSYFRGNDPARWQPEVPVWSRVRYRDLYPGIDLVLRGGVHGWQPTLEVQPGADPRAVCLQVEGADALTLEDAAVQLHTAAGAYRLPLLELRGATPGTSPALDGETVLAPFAAAPPAEAAAPARDVPREGVHDLVYATYLGGSDQDFAPALALDATGASYVTGDIASPDFPTTPGAFDPTWNGGYRDAVVAKLSPDGSALVYATFLGGSHGDIGYDVAVDAAGAAYVVGHTNSPEFPITPGAYSNTLHVGAVFVTKLSPTGAALAYSTFLGPGCSNDMGHQCGLTLDGAGNAYVVGMAGYRYPTTPGAFQTVCQLCEYYYEGFVTKLNAAGSALIYSTYLGGTTYDWVTRVAVDAAGAAYVSGVTDAADFPTTAGAFDTSYNGGDDTGDAFVAKLAPDGTALEYSTFLGGSQNECIYSDCAIAIDSVGAAYVTGNTQSGDFPTTPGAFDRTFHGGGYAADDAFVTKLTPDGAGLVYSTFLGGGGDDGGTDVGVDAAGRVCLTGYTWSSEFPTTPDAYDPFHHSSGAVAFITWLDAAGAGLDYSTFLSGSVSDDGRGIALDAAGAITVVGSTLSPDFPATPGAYDRTFNGGNGDLFVAKLVPHMEARTLLPLIMQNYASYGRGPRPDSGR